MGLIKPVDSGPTSIPVSQPVNAQNDLQAPQQDVTGKPATTQPVVEDSFGGVANAAEQQAVQNTVAAAGPQSVDWNSMSQDQKYDYLQKLNTANSGSADTWKTGDKEVNLVGVRGFSDGQANANEKDQYNDSIFACRMNNGKKEVYEFKGSTDPGADPTNQWHDRGDTFLAEGFYKDSWAKGKVSGGEQGLRQVDWVNVNVDANGNGKIDSNEGRRLQAGTGCQFQFHSGGDGDKVGKSSAGCQVIQNEQYADFQKLLSEAPDSQKFSYLLINGSKMPQDVNSDFGKTVGGCSKGIGNADGQGCYDKNERLRLSRGIGAGRGFAGEYEPPELNEIFPWLNGDGGIGIIQVPVRPTPAPTTPKPGTSTLPKG